MSTRYQIQKITVKSDLQELQILWADGHQSRYPFAGLRDACPCVTCKGGHEKMGGRPNQTVFLKPNTEKRMITKIQPVGNYALQIVWNDGHQSGLYRWQFLRDICPVENGVI